MCHGSIDSLVALIYQNWRLRLSFHVIYLPTISQWKCRYHLVKYTFSLEFGGQVAYMGTNL